MYLGFVTQNVYRAILYNQKMVIPTKVLYFVRSALKYELVNLILA